jgi:hypothetical protein
LDDKLLGKKAVRKLLMASLFAQIMMKDLVTLKSTLEMKKVHNKLIENLLGRKKNILVETSANYLG